MHYGLLPEQSPVDLLRWSSCVAWYWPRTRKGREKDMTNFEYWKDKLAEIVKADEDVAILSGKPLKCGEVACCNYCEREACSSPKELLKWMMEEYIEKPKLTKKEHKFCELVEDGYIGRNSDGGLHWYRHEPTWRKGIWHSDGCGCIAVWHNFPDMKFEYVKKGEKMSVEELLKLEVE